MYYEYNCFEKILAAAAEASVAIAPLVQLTSVFVLFSPIGWKLKKE